LANWQGALEKLEVTQHSLDKGFWLNKKVLLTGHTGFKGSWLSLWLNTLGANVFGVSLPPVPSGLFELLELSQSIKSMECDIRDSALLQKIIEESNPDIVFHLAAQSLVLPSYRDPTATFTTNVMGTVNLLDSLRTLRSTKVIIVVTTDKVYSNNHTRRPFKEDDPLGGYDPYSASKAAVEILVEGYRNSFFKAQKIALATARAGNVIGGGDWAEGRLMPDLMRSRELNQPLCLRHPNATRPWQHVLEPLFGYLRLAEYLWRNAEHAGPYNFGPLASNAASVKAVVELARSIYGSGEIDWLEASGGPYEAEWLELDTAKVCSLLKIKPRWGLEKSIKKTIDWYLSKLNGIPALELCTNDINEFSAAQ
jgi:CDP-glucose 4,6-dehydratase